MIPTATTKRPFDSASVLTGAALVLIHVAALYTYVPLAVAPGVSLPAALAAPIAAILLLKHASDVAWWELRPIAAYTAIVSLSLVLVPSPFLLLEERLQSLALLLFSITAGLALYLELRTWPSGRLSVFLLILVGVIIIGCIAENFAGLRSISDSFREAMFPEDMLYATDRRDEALAAIVRPKLFTSEPSFVAIHVLLYSVLWLMLCCSVARIVTFLALILLEFYLIRSPVLAFGILFGVVAFFSPARLAIGAVKMTRSARVVLVPFLAIMLVAGFFFVAGEFIAARASLIVAGRDDSYTLRVAAPMSIAAQAVWSHPFLGVGVGGEKELHSTMVATYRGLVDIERIVENLDHSVHNVFWLHWIYFGAVGGLVALLCLASTARRLAGRDWIFPMVVVLGFSQCMGGYVGPRFWYIYFFALAASRLAVSPDPMHSNDLRGGSAGSVWYA